MKVWVYVEGESDQLALNALWKRWRSDLRRSGWGIDILATGGKQAFLQKIGERVAQRLAANADDLVVALPDLYPMKPFAGTVYAHWNVPELAALLNKQTQMAVRDNQGIKADQLAAYLKRFLPSALRHDLEMLLLAAKGELRHVIGTNDNLGGWKKPVEDQNGAKPPKHVVQELFRTRSARKREYRETRDAPNVLGRVVDLRTLFFDENGQQQCPVFQQVVDWIAERTRVPAS